MKTSLIASLIFLTVFGLYMFTAVPSITGDDSGELAGVGKTLGTAHSPGYPLYSIAGKIFTAIIPWGNSAYRVNLVSCFSMALSAGVIFLIVSGISCGILISIVASLVFAFSNLVWSMSNVTEVYGIAAFVCCLICLVLSEQPSYRNYLLVCFLTGIGLSAHYTIGLIIPGILWWIVRNRAGIFQTKVVYGLLSGIMFAMLGFSIVLFIYVRAKQNPVFGWEDPKTLERFWQVIARLRYGTIALAQGGLPKISYVIIYQKSVFYLKSLVDNFSIAGAIVFAIGLYFSVRRNSFGWSLIIMFLTSGPGFILLANAGLDQSSAALLKRFFFLSMIFAAIILGKGLSQLPDFAGKLSVFIPVFLLFNNLPGQNRRNEYLFYDYAKNMIRCLPEKTILFSDRADEMEFCIGYLRYAENLRPDIDFIDCNAGITRSIYGGEYYRIWGKKRLAIREKVEKEIIAKTDRPVFYATFVPDMINVPRYQKGLVFRVKPPVGKERNFNFDEIYSIRIPQRQSELDERGRNLLMSYYQLMGEYWLSENNALTAEKCFKGLIAFDTSRRQSANAAFLYHNKGMLDFASKYYNEAIKCGAKDAAIYINLGTIYEQRGDTKSAEDLYLQALNFEPENVQSHYNLAVLYWKQTKWEKVIKELETVMKLDPANSHAETYLAMARKRIERH